MFRTLVFEDYDHSTVANTAGKFWCMHATPSLFVLSFDFISFYTFCLHMRRTHLFPLNIRTDFYIFIHLFIFWRLSPVKHFELHDLVWKTPHRFKFESLLACRQIKWLCRIKNKKKMTHRLTVTRGLSCAWALQKTPAAASPQQLIASR